MNISNNALWWLLMAVGLAGSAVYSGLETGIYSINRVRLQILHHKRVKAAGILHRLVQHPQMLLSTLLIGNNVTNYMGTAAMTVILQQWGLSDLKVIIVIVLLITPALLIFGEVLPKDLFTAYSDKWVYRCAWFLDLSQKLFFWIGLLPLIQALSGLSARVLGVHHRSTPFHPRRQVEMLVKEGVGHGLLSDEQSAIVERVLELSTRHADDEMVPWGKTLKVYADDAPRVMWDLAHRTSHTRFPVIDRKGTLRGIISVYDVLKHAPNTCPPLESLLTPALTLDAQTPLRTALATLQSEHAALAVITRQGQPVGVVTIKDLVEPITGELASW